MLWSRSWPGHYLKASDRRSSAAPPAGQKLDTARGLWAIANGGRSSPFGEIGSSCAGAAAVDDQERDERRLDRLVGEADGVQRSGPSDREVSDDRQRGVADQQGAGDGLEA